MSEQDLNKHLPGDQPQQKEPEILRNEIGKVVDPNVVIDEADRTVLLTENETIVIEKEPRIDIRPVNRPRKVYTGMWGPVEIGVVGAGMLAVLGAVLLYVFLVVPSNRAIEDNRARRDRLETELTSAKQKFGNISSVEHRVSELLTSINDFEAQYLPVPTTGRTALYQRINALIASYGLVNSAGPDYAPLEIVDPGKAGEEEDKSGKAKFRSFFPGVYVSVTVEGQYPNLRRFIRELETSGSEFVVVSAVELEPSDAQQEKQDQINATQAGFSDPNFNPTTVPGTRSIPAQPQAPLPQSARGKTHGSMVSLRLEMAAYFRRPALAPVETSLSQQ